MNCPLKYIEQVGQTLYTGYKKQHIQAITNNNGKSGCLNCILNTGHAFGSTTDTTKVVK
jgi:hypothetical protein